MGDDEGVVRESDHERTCRECGCTDLTACVDEFDMPCSWVEWDLCSMCAPEQEARALSPYVRGEDPELDRMIDAAWSEVVLPMIDRAFKEDRPKREPWYCGDPGCWVCRERGLVPEEEAVS